jgi:hypothetical protein
VPSISEALRETFLQPIHAPYRELINADLVRRILAQRTLTGATKASTNGAPTDAGSPPLQDGEQNKAAGHPAASREALLDEVEQKTLRLAQEITAYTEGTGDAPALAQEIRIKLETILQLDTLPVRSILRSMPDYAAAVDYMRESLGDEEWTWGALLAWLFTHPLGKLVTATDFAGQSRSWVDEWLLRKIIARMLQDLGADEATASRGILLVNALITQQRCLTDEAGERKAAYHVITSWLKDEDVRSFLQVNRYQNVLWYNKEAFDQMLGLLLLAAIVDSASKAGHEPAEIAQEIRAHYAVVRVLRQAQAESDYRVEKLLAAAQRTTRAPAAS